MTVRARIKGWIGAALWLYHAPLAAELVLRNRRGLGVGEDLYISDVEFVRVLDFITEHLTPIGCLYNFDYRGAVSFYQSGLRIEPDNRRKPGYICHAEAIRHSLAGGRDVYDFMASFDEYKERMAPHRRDLVWARIQKPKLKFTVERKLRTVALWAAARDRAAQSGRRRPSRLEATA